jgi:hypothetical protein
MLLPSEGYASSSNTSSAISSNEVLSSTTARVAEVPVDHEHLVTQTLIADHAKEALAHFLEPHERIRPHAEPARDVLALGVALATDEDAGPSSSSSPTSMRCAEATHLQREIVEHVHDLPAHGAAHDAMNRIAFAAWSNAWIARVRTMASLKSLELVVQRHAHAIGAVPSVFSGNNLCNACHFFVFGAGPRPK